MRKKKNKDGEVKTQDVLVGVKFKVPILWSLFFSLFGNRVRKKKNKTRRGKNSKCVEWSQILCKVNTKAFQQ